MRITPQASLATRTCAICERTLLVGERSVRYSPNGEDFVDVCPLCQDEAVDHGWLKEGSPTTPVVSERRRKRNVLGSLFESRKPASEPVVDEPILRRLSEPELAMVEAAELFNGTAFRRTVSGIAKSLGEPRASIVPLSGVSGELADLSMCDRVLVMVAGRVVGEHPRGWDEAELVAEIEGIGQ